CYLSQFACYKHGAPNGAERSSYPACFCLNRSKMASASKQEAPPRLQRRGGRLNWTCHTLANGLGTDGGFENDPRRSGLPQLRADGLAMACRAAVSFRQTVRG